MSSYERLVEAEVLLVSAWASAATPMALKTMMATPMILKKMMATPMVLKTMMPLPVGPGHANAETLGSIARCHRKACQDPRCIRRLRLSRYTVSKTLSDSTEISSISDRALGNTRALSAGKFAGSPNQFNRSWTCCNLLSYKDLPWTMILNNCDSLVTRISRSPRWIDFVRRPALPPRGWPTFLLWASINPWVQRVTGDLERRGGCGGSGGLRHGGMCIRWNTNHTNLTTKQPLILEPNCHTRWFSILGSTVVNSHYLSPIQSFRYWQGDLMWSMY